MAYNLPEGFELVEDTSIPDGFEIVDDSPGFWSQVGDIASTLGRESLGAVAGVGDIISGAATAIPLWMKAQMDVAMGGDPRTEREEMGQSMQSLSPSQVAPGLRDTQAYQNLMYPFQKMEEGTDWLVEQLGGGDAAKLGVQGPLMALPIPFAGRAARGLGKIAETVDPGLRGGEFQKPPALPDGDRPAPARQAEIPQGWEEVPPNPQLDFMEPINPYDVGGHVSALQEGRATTVDVPQLELGGMSEVPNRMQQSVIDAEVARRDAEYMRNLQQAEQGSLFEPQTSMNRAYDQWGPDALPRQLSRQEFEQTARNLSEQEGTRYTMPEDIDAAYQQYLLDMEGRQAGLFDRPSQQQGFAQQAQIEGNARMAEAQLQHTLQTHPDLVNTRKAVERLEGELATAQRRHYTRKAAELEERLDIQKKRLETLENNIRANFVPSEMGIQGPNWTAADLRPGVDSIPGITPRPGSRGSTRDVGLTPDNSTPAVRSQNFRNMAESIPGLQQKVQVVPREQPTQPAAQPAPINKVIEAVPNLGKQAERFIRENQTPQQVIEASRGDKDTKAGAFRRQFFSGANMAAMITESNLIKGINGFMNRAETTYNKVLRQEIIPIERSLYKLNKNERVELASVLKEEMFGHQLMSPEALQQRFQNNPKLGDAYLRLREGLISSGEALNRGRAAAGLPPVSLKEYYVSSRWRGNFKTAAYSDGKLVGYLRENSKKQLAKSKAAMEKQFPNIQWKDDTSTRSHTPSDTLEASFYDALRLLDQNDPIVQSFAKAVEDQLASQGSQSLGMLYHGETKADVRGFIGDKPHKTDQQNALELLNSQLQYMKSTHKWAHQQEAVAKAKEVLSDPELQATQPNNVAYAKDYIRNALGFGTLPEVRNIESFITQALGYDRDAAMAGLNNLRSYFYTKQLGLLNPKATLVQVTQPLFSIPAHLDLVNAGFPYNPVTHFADLTADFYKMYSGKSDRMTPEGRAAIEYGKEHGILSMNVLDEIRNIGDGPIKRGAVKLANINQIKAEEFGRAFTFLSAVHHMKQSGLKGEPLYLSAEAFTNRVMADYRRFEQPMWMEKGGLASRSAGTLKTFVNNMYNQILYYGKQAAKGNVAPAISHLGVQWALAGTLGMLGAETAIDIYDNLIRPMLGPKQADKSLRLGLLNNMDDLVAYGGFSKLTGANMFGSLSQGTLAGADDAMSFFMPFMSDIFKTIQAGGKLALDPTDSDKWRTFIYENMPPHAKGAMENLLPSLTSEQGYSLNPRDTTRGMYKRNDFERTLRYLGATSLKEYSTKERAFAAQTQEKEIAEAKRTLKDEYVSALKEGDQATMQEVITVLQRWMGPDEIAKFLIQGVEDRYKNRNRDVFERLLPEGVRGIGSQRQVQRIRESMR